MSFIIGEGIHVSTDYVKSHPAIPVYKGSAEIKNLYAVIYHIEIGYNKDNVKEIAQYIIVDYKDYKLGEKDKEEILKIADGYCVKKGINNDKNLEIKLLDDEIAENFVEKIFNNMKIIRGMISND